MSQRDLFSPPPEGAPPLPRKQAWTPHVRDSETSLRAAASMAPRAARTIRSKVLEHLREHPSTDEEICDALGLSGNTIRPRRRELEVDGLVHHTGTSRSTRSGRLAAVWTAVPVGEVSRG